MSSTEENQDLYRELQELRDRVDELENQEKNDSGLPTPSRRTFLTALAGAGAASLSTTPASAQGVSACSFRSHCVLQGSPSDRPDPRPDCKYVYLEGTPSTPDQQVIRYTEDGAWELFDVVPKDLYGRVYPDHPDYTSIDDALTHQTQTSTPPSIALLGDDDYGNVTMPDDTALQGAGFESNLDALTMGSGGNNIAFFLQATGTVDMYEFCMIETAYLTNGNDINLNEQAASLLNCTMLTNSVTVDGDACTIIGNRNATSFTTFSITVNGDNCTVTNNTRTDVTDNSTGSRVANNT